MNLVLINLVMNELRNVGHLYKALVSDEISWGLLIFVSFLTETILLSVLSMLSDPNCDSAANIDASIMWRDDRAAFRRKVSDCVRKTLEEI